MAERAFPARMGPTFEVDWPGASARATECIMNVVLAGDWVVDRLSLILRAYDLTPAAAQVLSIVHGAGEPIPHHVIGERMLVSRGTVTWLVDRLEQRGLVRRIASPNDRRTILVAVTDEALALLQEFRPRIHQLDRDLVAGLSPEEQETLIDLLSRIQQKLQNEPKE